MARKTLSPSVLVALGLSGAASQASRCGPLGPCLDVPVESDTDTDTDTDSDTDDSDTDDSDTDTDTDTQPCLDVAPYSLRPEPRPDASAGSTPLPPDGVVDRVLDKGVLPEDVAARLRDRKAP